MNTKLFVPFTTLILLTGIFAVPELLTADEADEQRVAERQDEEARRDEINAKRKEIIRKIYQLKRELKELEEAGVDRIQFNVFYDALTTGKDREWLQQSSLETWILMEACNESARRNEKVDLIEFKKNLIEG